MWNFGDHSVRAVWPRVCESAESLAERTWRFLMEFSSRVEVGGWRSATAEWDGRFESLPEMIRSGVSLDANDEPRVAAGFSYRADVDSGPLQTGVSFQAGQHKLHPRIVTPAVLHKFWRSTCADLNAVVSASFVGLVRGFDPAYVVHQKAAINRLARRGEWLLPVGYRVWINEWIGAVSLVADGVRLERFEQGSLIRVPVSWQPRQVVDAVLETYRLNGLDEVPVDPGLFYAQKR